MNRSLPFLAMLALASSSCSQEDVNEDVAVAISTIPVSIGDGREEVIASMGMPNAAATRDGQSELVDSVIFAPTDTPREEIDRLAKEEQAKFRADPEVHSSPVWKYYGYGSNDRFVAIYFKGDTVIGLTHGMTQDMIGGGYAR